MTNQEKILSKIKALVEEEIPDAKVYLFGSRARGDWHDESD
jgi:predicted nucleotidyltransferase